MKIAVIGTGYVGLVSGACFSHLGMEVVCVDQDAIRVRALESGQIPIFEPGLDEVVKDCRARDRLKFTTDINIAIKDAAAIFIAVGTPTDEKNGRADLKYVFEAGQQLARALTQYAVIVIKSTVPVGTAQRLRETMIEANPKAVFDIASNPEFLREGSAVDDFLHPDRVVIGVDSSTAEAVMRQLYHPLSNNNVPVIFTSSASAEMIKYAANCYLAMRIGYVNQIADLCEKVGADIREVAQGMGLDKRIGLHYLAPGPGFGGSCFPKDTKALINIARDFDTPMSIIEDVIAANDRRRGGIVDRVNSILNGDLKGKKIAVLGVAFKAETDDIRDAAAIEVIPALQAAGALISAYDPAGMEHGKKAFQNVTWGKDPYSVAEQADLILVLTEWQEFRSIDLVRLKGAVKAPVIMDYRNLYLPQDVKKAGFTYHSLGRASYKAD
jgi:UDPglucose 6-dehydrogenase